MICDAGGATVDLTTYTIKKIEPLQLVEFVQPLSKTLVVCKCLLTLTDT